MTKKKKITNKTAFVLGLGDISAKEAIERGKKAGIKLTDRYIYSIRSKAKQRGGKPAGRRGRPPKAAQNGTNGSSHKPAFGSSKLEQQFTGIALELGLSHAEALLKDIRTRPFF